MVEEQKKRVEESTTKIVDNIDRAHLRKMQGDMHRCAAACCGDESYSLQRVHQCIDNCSINLQKAQKYVQNEFERSQNRLQRCVMDCNDKIRDKVGPNPSQNDVDKYNGMFDQCATKCVDNYCDYLPNLEQNIKQTLSSNKFV